MILVEESQRIAHGKLLRSEGINGSRCGKVIVIDGPGERERGRERGRDMKVKGKKIVLTVMAVMMITEIVYATVEQMQICMCVYV